MYPYTGDNRPIAEKQTWKIDSSSPLPLQKMAESKSWDRNSDAVFGLIIRIS
jgi:hypothetical protein